MALKRYKIKSHNKEEWTEVTKEQYEQSAIANGMKFQSGDPELVSWSGHHFEGKVEGEENK